MDQNNLHIYKKYDIRGKAPEEISKDVAHKIGMAYAEFVKPETVVVGYDIRSTSPDIQKGVMEGLIDMGVDVIDIGLVSTPMLYFATGHLKTSGGIMVTGSHLPCEKNGLKFCREEAIPISMNTGIADIRDLVVADNFTPAQNKGVIHAKDIKSEYYTKIVSLVPLTKKFKVAIDPGNMMGIEEITLFKEYIEVEPDVYSIYDEYDETCPNHEPNPIKFETLKDLGQEVVEKKANIGLAFDGDADRTGIVDELGNPVPADIVAALISRELLKSNPGTSIAYDLRSSKTTLDIVTKLGGTAIESKVGHAFVKETMREYDGIFGFELTAHYFFKNNFYAESGSLPALYLLKIMEDTGKSLSELVSDISIYYQSGEINTVIKTDPEDVFNILISKYNDGDISKLDGIKISYKDWWFNVRSSNTEAEPIIRLNLEADTQELMEERRDEVLSLIRS